MKMPNIFDAEWEIMKVFWEKNSPCTANEVVEIMSQYTKWKPNTIKTLISRLVKKQAVGFKEEGRLYLYFALVPQADMIKAESKSFLQRVFGGAVKPMLVNFLQEEKLSPQEIEELKRLLEGQEG